MFFLLTLKRQLLAGYLLTLSKLLRNWASLKCFIKLDVIVDTQNIFAYIPNHVRFGKKLKWNKTILQTITISKTISTFIRIVGNAHFFVTFALKIGLFHLDF